MSFTCKLVILFIFLTTSVQAQISIHPSPINVPTCLDKKDAYSLALADMQGTLTDLWGQFVTEGRCRFMSATYLFTVDIYKDNTNETSRVVELLAFGERMWGIRATLPKGVWTL